MSLKHNSDTSNGLFCIDGQRAEVCAGFCFRVGATCVLRLHPSTFLIIESTNVISN